MSREKGAFDAVPLFLNPDPQEVLALPIYYVGRTVEN
jgi:hypothetical protein